MFKKLVLIFSLLATVGVSAVAGSDQASTEEVSASKPGIFKKAYNFCWGKRSGLAKTGIATVTLLPSAICLGLLGRYWFNNGFKYKDLKGLCFLIPGLSHVALYAYFFGDDD